MHAEYAPSRRTFESGPIMPVITGPVKLAPELAASRWEHDAAKQRKPAPLLSAWPASERIVVDIPRARVRVHRMFRARLRSPPG